MPDKSELLAAYMERLANTHQATDQDFYTILLQDLNVDPIRLHLAMKDVKVSKTGRPEVDDDEGRELKQQAALDAVLKGHRPESIREDDPEGQLQAVLEVIQEMNIGYYFLSVLPDLIEAAAEWARRALLTDPALYDLDEGQLNRLKVSLKAFTTSDDARVNFEFFETVIKTLETEKNAVLITQILVLFRKRTGINAQSLRDIHQFRVIFTEIFEQDKTDTRRPSKELVAINEFIYQLSVWFMDVVPRDLNDYI